MNRVFAGSEVMSVEYRDFELQIGPRTGDKYLARVNRSPAGRGEALFDIPPLAFDLAARLGRTRALRPQENLPARGLKPLEVGEELFRALFSGNVGRFYYQSLDSTGIESEKGLRIRLLVDFKDASSAQLRNVPWELLYRSETGDALALSRRTPVVRTLAVPRPLTPQTLEPPLRVLIVSSEAPTMAPLDLGDELEKLVGILGTSPYLEVEHLENPDLRKIRATLNGGEFHVLHYMGHGAFDDETGEGVLVFRAQNGGVESMDGWRLANVIKDFDTLRLVVLNACDTARSGSHSGGDPFAGVATALALGGIPAVIAMQAPIEDRLAVDFCEALYEQLALGYPVDQAITEGRQAIYSSEPEGAWAIPVLFMQTPNGELFKRRDAPAKRPERRGWRRWTGYSAAASLLSFALFMSRDSSTPPPTTEGEPRTAAGEKRESDVIRSTPPPPAREPSADPTVRVGSLRYEISANSPRTFAAELKEAAGRDSEAEELKSLAWTVKLDVAEPEVTLSDLDGVTRYSCMIAVDDFRIVVGEQSVALGATDSSAMHSFEDQACKRAASLLAEAVNRELLNYYWRNRDVQN